MASDRIALGEKIGYGLGDLASNLFFQTFNILLLYYYTDIFGLAAAWVGTMMMVARLWDAVSDPLMGVIADRTNTRWGRYRPYLLWMAVPYGVIGFSIFANPTLDDAGKKIYAAVTYVAMMTAYTAINIPYSALMGVMSRSSSERTTLSTFRFLGAFGGALVISVSVLPLKNWLGGVDPSLTGEALRAAEAHGFQLTMAMFAILSILCFLVTFATTRERINPPQRGESFSIRRDMSLLLRNRPWIVLFAAAILTLTNVAVRNGAIIYYFKYYVGSEAQATMFFLTGGTAMLLGVASTKLFTKRWSKKSLLIVLSTLNALSILAFFFIPPEQVLLMHIVNAVGTFIVGPTPALVWAMYSDTADYAEWKFHRRATALTFSSAMFAQKMGLALGAGMAGWILTGMGFVANQVQTDEALLGIRLVFSVVPASFAILNAVVILFYPLGENAVREIERDLKLRANPEPDNA